MDEGLREIFCRELYINEVRKWEDLNIDCLLNIFERVGLNPLIFDLPFVCKSWYKASRDPYCWKILDFTCISFEQRYFESIIFVNGQPPADDDARWCLFTKFVIKFAADHSCGIATTVVFHHHLFYNILQYPLERCPAVKNLILPHYCIPNLSIRDELKDIPKLIHKWKDLESLSLSCYSHFTAILAQIQIHCKKLVSLTTSYYIGTRQASAIVTFVPNIKHLVLRSCFLPRKNLIRILSGCRELELLDVTSCTGFDADDVEILTMASYIKTFMSNDSEEDDIDPDWGEEESASDISD
ncbi:F-box/LRR-repeat protein [Thalictrum thalictroides]|uniref:F-box/LRR-repeat protein n=1 Tax=Thalictrum thalictroides TaxID=46969 RepID=A0A7J6X7D4_THATH|nr:F-box/LRR-repeat protein [Thalictrum thalictroides]